MPYKKPNNDGIADRFITEFDELKKQDPDVYQSIDISPSYVSQIRSGSRQPTIAHLTNLILHYRYSGTWLLTGIGEKKNEPVQKGIDKRLEVIELKLDKLATALSFKEATRGNKKGNK